MSLLRRLLDIFKSNVNDTLDKVEDPEKMLKQMLIDMESAVEKAISPVAYSMANQKSIERKIEKYKNDTVEWEHKAEQALKANREDLAVAALERKAISEKNYNDLLPIFDKAKITSETLQKQLEQFKLKLEETRSKQGILIARSQAAKAQKMLNSAVSGLGSGVFSNFERIEQKIEILESEANAHSNLIESENSLENEIKKITTNKVVEEDLARLKLKLGISKTLLISN
jgi:phage shock protein A